MGWLWWVLYHVGAMVTLRQFVLAMENLRERRHNHRWYNQPEMGFLVFVVPFWPIVAVAVLSWKAIFPRGVKSRNARKQEREERKTQARRELEAARVAAAKREEMTYREAEEILKSFMAQPDALAMIPEPTEFVMPHDLADMNFTDACDQVWRDRGQPWSIGTLANVGGRIRAKVGK